MDKQQQVLEMAKDICRVKLNCNDVCNPISACDALKYAERAVEAGYCKRTELVQEIADFIYDSEMEGLNIEMNGRYLGKNDFIKEFTTPKGAEDTTTPTKKDYYTPEEVRSMSPREVRDNIEIIRRSMKMWR